MKQWETEELFEDSDLFFDAFLRAIRSAVKTITLETYIFSDDAFGDRVVNAIGAAAGRGVHVRLLIDGIGSMDWPDRYWWELKSAGVEVRVYRPLPWDLAWLGRLGRLQLGTVARLFGRINARNHRKVMIVDGRQAWLGSMNISGCHLREFAGDQAWRDTGLAVSGSPVHELTFAFEEAWHDPAIGSWKALKLLPKQLRNPAARAADAPVRQNYRLRLRRFFYQDLIRRLKEADTCIHIVTPYFVPDMRLVRAIAKAARRGVDVRLLVPQQSDVIVVRFASKAYYKTLLSSGVRIFEYLPSVLHAKIMRIDEWCLVGSSNVNSRSLFHDLEVDVVVTRAENKMLLQSGFQRDIERSSEVHLENWMGGLPFARWFYRIFLWIRHWL